MTISKLLRKTRLIEHLTHEYLSNKDLNARKSFSCMSA